MAMRQGWQQELSLPSEMKISDLTSFIVNDAICDDVSIKFQRLILDTLFSCTTPIRSADSDESEVLWIEESNHRAMTYLRLMLWLKNSRFNAQHSIRNHNNYLDLAIRIATSYHSVQRVDHRGTSGCRRPLVDLVVGLTSLFDWSTSSIKLNYTIEDINLSIPKLRALVLITGELFTYTLGHILERRLCGELSVTVIVQNNMNVSFIFEDDVVDSHLRASGPGHHIVSRLSGLLCGDLVYKTSPGRGSRVELSFLLNAPSSKSRCAIRQDRGRENNSADP